MKSILSLKSASAASFETVGGNFSEVVFSIGPGEELGDGDGERPALGVTIGSGELLAIEFVWSLEAEALGNAFGEEEAVAFAALLLRFTPSVEQAMKAAQIPKKRIIVM